MGKSPPDSRSRRTKHKRAMKLAISLLFIAAVSKEAPSVTLRRTMPTGHAENTLAQNQKQTAMKIQKDVVPWIQHLENILKLSIERQHNETSQLYKYIDATTSHTTAELVKRIIDLKENTDESLKALEENTTESFTTLRETRGSGWLAKTFRLVTSLTRHVASSGCLRAAAENTRSVWGWSRGSSTGSSPSASH